MNSRREEFLQRVRQAVAAGNKAGTPRQLEPRLGVSYQGAGTDLVAGFREQLAAAGGTTHFVADSEATMAKVLDIVREKSARRIAMSQSPILQTLNLAGRLGSTGLEVLESASLTESTAREPLFAADLGITGVDYLIAETGSVVLLAQPGEPRSVSLLPPVHIAIGKQSQLLSDLFDLFETAEPIRRGAMPSCVSVITGPSKTGDIELRLVTGVHGPGEIHVILIAD